MTCPSTLITRTGSPLDGNQTLDASEEAYIEERRATVLAPLWSSYLADSSTGVTGKELSTRLLVHGRRLTRGYSTGYNLTQVFPSAANYPRLSTAVSGGGVPVCLFLQEEMDTLCIVTECSPQRCPLRRGHALRVGLTKRYKFGRDPAVIGLPGRIKRRKLVCELVGDERPPGPIFFGAWRKQSDRYARRPQPRRHRADRSLSGWSFDLGLLDPAGVLGISDNTDYCERLSRLTPRSNLISSTLPVDILLADVQAKANAGYPVSLEDVWGRGLSFHFFNGTNRRC